MFDTLLYLFLGVLIGFITGLIPGLHPNTIFVFIVSLPVMMTTSLTNTLVFIVSTSLSNTFTDFIPSIFFGAPEEDSCLSTLPGHRMFLEGRGYEALLLTVIGGLGVSILFIISLPITLILIPFLYSHIHAHLHIILILIAVWMIMTEKGLSKFYAILVFLMSGLFGTIALNTISPQTSIFPALTGMFGVSVLILSLKRGTKPPEQKITTPKRRHIKGIITGWLAGFFVGMLPGIGSSQAGVIASQLCRANKKDFLTALGGINTTNIFFTIMVFYILNKTRSGTVWAISQFMNTITFNQMLILVFSGLSACFISALTTIYTGKLFTNIINKIRYNTITISVLIVLPLIVVFFTGFVGLLIMIIGMFIGVFTNLLGIKRTHLMGFLMLPTIFYYAGLSGTLTNLLGI